jgi:hypothetical protein
MHDPTAVTVLIGDVVGSRDVPDRAGLQRVLESALAEVGRATGGELAMTIGDEFQGRFPSIDAALAASLRLHLSTREVTALRLGLGWGDLVVDRGDATFHGQDGPAWWRARDGLETLAGPAGPVRTVIVTETGWDEVLNGYLALRDTVVTGLDAGDAVICLGLLDGETQRALAGRLGLHESSVSRRVSRHGLATLVGAARPAVPLPAEARS